MLFFHDIEIFITLSYRQRGVRSQQFMPQDPGQEDVVGHVNSFEFVAAVPVGVKLHTVNTFQLYVFLERLVEGVFFEVLNQKRDGVWVGPCLGAVVAGSQPVGVVSLIDKGAVVLDEFLYRRPEAAG